MAFWQKIDGIINAALKFGFTGAQIKKNASDATQLDVRNNADSADGKLNAGLLSATSVVVKSSDEHKTTITMATGASGDIAFVLPNNDGNSGDSLVTDGSGNLSFGSPGAGTIKVSKFALAFDSSSPVNLVNMSDGTIIDKISVEVTTAFDGTGGRTLSIGVSGTVEKYVAAAEIDLTTTGKYLLDVAAFEAAAAQMIATFTAASSGGAAGSATILCYTGVPS